MVLEEGDLPRAKKEDLAPGVQEAVDRLEDELSNFIDEQEAKDLAAEGIKALAKKKADQATRLEAVREEARLAELKRLRAEQEMRDLERKEAEEERAAQAEEERAAQALAKKAKAAATAAALAKSPVRVKGPPSEAVSPATAELQRLMMEEDELKKQISMAEAAKADLKKRKLQEARERNQQLKEKLAKISDSKASDGEGESEATSVATKLQPEKPPALCLILPYDACDGRHPSSIYEDFEVSITRQHLHANVVHLLY